MRPKARVAEKFVSVMVRCGYLHHPAEVSSCGWGQATQFIRFSGFFTLTLGLTFDCLPAIRSAIDSGASGGYFAFRFSNANCWQSRLLEKLINMRTRFGIPYGDQGLFFQHDIYLSSGQHDASPLFEEVELVRRVRIKADS